MLPGLATWHACHSGTSAVRPNPQLQLLHVTAALLALLLALPRAHGCPLRVLAFGDSLTEGLYLDPASGQHGFHSYALRLRELLRDALPAGCHVVVHERGRSGEKVVPAMQERLQRALAEAAANGEAYGWVLLLGGTNDIGTGAAVADVLAALASMHDAIHAAGARLVAMTLPPFNTRLPAERRAAYNALNEGLRQRLANVSAAARQAPASGEAQANAGAHTEAVAASGAQRQVRPRGHRRRSALVDLEPLFPVEAVDPEVKKATWSDHLHLTPAGYGQMAEAVFSAMLGHHWRRAGSGADESIGSGDSRSDASSASSAG